LNLLLAAKVVCNTVHMQACLRRFQADGEIVSDDDLRYLSPLMRRRLGLYGQYNCVLSVTSLDLSHAHPANLFRRHSRSPKGYSMINRSAKNKKPVFWDRSRDNVKG